MERRVDPRRKARPAGGNMLEMGREVTLRLVSCRALRSCLPWVLVLALGAAGSAACQGQGQPPPSPSTDAVRPTEEGKEAPPPTGRPRVVMLGDSLTAGYGLPSKDDAVPALLQRRVDAAGLGFEVVNMGVSGDTTAGGLRRLDWALEGDVRVLVIALGGNDGLRGLGVEQMRANLAAMIERARARGIDVLLCGMEAPPNLGHEYAAAFRQVFTDLARQHGVELLPFLLEGVAGDPAMNQPDGIHPNRAGTERVAALIWARLRPMLEARRASIS